MRKMFVLILLLIWLIIWGFIHLDALNAYQCSRDPDLTICGGFTGMSIIYVPLGWIVSGFLLRAVQQRINTTSGWRKLTLIGLGLLVLGASLPWGMIFALYPGYF